MEEQEFRFRQIHLDFHTSEQIPKIGAAFDPTEFASTLERARVNSITCFGRCHHGWLYYDSRRFPERIHPNLTNRSLLEEQIEACHSRGIRVPIYVTVQWDDYTAKHHPEWRVVSADGRLSGTPPYEAGFYRDLCVKSPYRDFLFSHVDEILETLPVDGFFFDIVGVRDCSCRYCLEGMAGEGLDPARGTDRLAYARRLMDGFRLAMSHFVQERNPECTIFYNAGHVDPSIRESAEAYTHLELESLPTGGWGYIHFPLTMRYARTLGKECGGMTGKFHTSWGDFHSFKSRPALEFECFSMLALNAKCMVGDQLHPEGKLCEHVYDLIGSVYSEVQKKEPWCRGARAVTDIGVLNPAEFDGDRIPPAAAGAVRVLQGGGHQFDVVDSRSDLGQYALLILPDSIPVSRELAAELNTYLEGGGKLIATAASGLDPTGSAFVVDLGVRPAGPLPITARPAEHLVDYILPREKLAEGLPPTEHVMYSKAVPVEAGEDAEVLADVILPYFDRTWEHFCSHRQAPSSREPGGPAVVQKGNALYYAHPLFTIYERNAPVWCRKLLLNGVELLLEEPVLRHDGPTSLLASVNEQTSQNRWVVHLLHYVPERRSREIDSIEDLFPLYDIALSVRVPSSVRAIRCVPDGPSIEYEEAGGRVEFVVPRLEGHLMVEISF